MNIWNTMEKSRIYEGGYFRSPSGCSPFGSLNRRICGFATGYAQISQGETSHIPGTICKICITSDGCITRSFCLSGETVALKQDDNNEEVI